jgi:hypothetical protein
MEEQQIAQKGVIVWGGEIIGGRDHEQDVGALFVDGGIDADSSNFLEVVDGEIEAVLEAVGLNSEMIAGTEAIGDGFYDPVDIAADEVEEFAADHGDFGGIDTVGAEDGATAAFGALVEVIKPLFEDGFVEIAGAGDLSEFSGDGKIPAVDGAEEFGSEHGHVLWVAGTDIEVALIGTGSAADANVHEQAERSVFGKSFFHSVEDDLLPVGREFPVCIEGLPVAWIGEIEIAEMFGSAAVTKDPFAEFHGRVEPTFLGRFVADGQQLLGVRGLFSHG